MQVEPNVEQLAVALRLSIGLLVHRLRQVHVDGELSLPETSALARLDRGGPTTASALARLEQISPQSVGTTLKELETRGLIERHPDPEDGRRAVMSLTDSGRRALRDRRNARIEHLAQALSSEFSSSELEHLMAAAPLLERLAQSI